jgi:endonuclease/exonuclease/phosphatase family metal-dependent hydrolase
MVALIEDEQPDLLGIQEAWVEAAGRNRPTRRAVHLRAVADRLAYHLSVPTISSSLAAWDRNSTGVPLLIREGDVEVLEQTAVPLGGVDDLEASMAIRTHFRWQGREAVVYNVHLRSFGDEKPWQDRRSLFAVQTWIPYLRQYRTVFRERADETDQLAEQIDAETLPVLIIGDFNSTADNWTYRRLRGDRIDAFRVAGAGNGHTYRSDKPLVRIAFVIVDRAWEVTMAEVPFVAFSDHRPVVARLRWRAEDTL